MMFCDSGGHLQTGLRTRLAYGFPVALLALRQSLLRPVMYCRTIGNAKLSYLTRSGVWNNLVCSVFQEGRSTSLHYCTVGMCIDIQVPVGLERQGQRRATFHANCGDFYGHVRTTATNSDRANDNA
jgi:hypothetical protein